MFMLDAVPEIPRWDPRIVVKLCDRMLNGSVRVTKRYFQIDSTFGSNRGENDTMKAYPSS